MKSFEAFVAAESEYFNYTPSITAKHTFFYPLCTGRFLYQPGYHLQRNAFNSFLLMYIEKGELDVTWDGHAAHAKAGEFVLLDCYQPHGYSSFSGWKSLWIHFDGPLARAYYQLLVSQLGTVFKITDARRIIENMKKLYHTFSTNEVIYEVFLSKLLTDIFTDMLVSASCDTVHDMQKEGRLEPEQKVQLQENPPTTNSMEVILSYINEHFAEKLTIEQLAKIVSLSPYHFIRVFKSRVGFTPHEYLLHTRLDNSKYLLMTTSLSIKDICFHCGFSSESVFCAAFKKNIGLTPMEYKRAPLGAQ